jgi:hypothetical protein
MEVKLLMEYDNLLAEATTKAEIFRATAKDYIPRMFAALQDENPNMSPADIGDRIRKDCVNIWSRRTILDALPDEAKNSEKQELGRLGQKKRNSAAVSAAPIRREGREQILIDADNHSLPGTRLDSTSHESEISPILSLNNLVEAEEQNQSLTSNPLELSQQFSILKKQLAQLQEQHSRDANKIEELELALTKTTFKTADKLSRPDMKNVLLDLERFGAQLFAALRNKKKSCSMQIDENGVVTGLIIPES